MKFDVELDVRKLSCPLPILRTKKSLATMSSGQVLKVMATDGGAPRDFADFCSKTGNELLSLTEAGGEFVFLIRRR
jgi:tRNA 2-thiouridine synthesizing protein A